MFISRNVDYSTIQIKNKWEKNHARNYLRDLKTGGRMFKEFLRRLDCIDSISHQQNTRGTAKVEKTSI
jgi:hypothetical protein